MLNLKFKKCPKVLSSLFQSFHGYWSLVEILEGNELFSKVIEGSHRQYIQDGLPSVREA